MMKIRLSYLIFWGLARSALYEEEKYNSEIDELKGRIFQFRNAIDVLKNTHEDFYDAAKDKIVAKIKTLHEKLSAFQKAKLQKLYKVDGLEFKQGTFEKKLSGYENEKELKKLQKEEEKKK